MTNRRMCRLWLFVAGLFVAATSAAADQVVKKDIGNFGPGQWATSMWSSAKGEVTGGQELTAVVHYSGKGFQHYTLSPLSPLLIPGVAKSLTVRFKSGAGFSFGLKLKDGWGREEPDGKKLEWWPKAGKAGEWQEATWVIPAGTVMPVQVTGFFTHNWGNDKKASDFTFSIGRLQAETDLSAVDPATGKLKSWKPEPNPKNPKEAWKDCPAVPLQQATISSGEYSNVYAGKEPQVHVILSNWYAAPAKGKLTYRILDNADKEVKTGVLDVQADSFSDIPLPLPVPAFGRYKFVADLNIEGGVTAKEELGFAYLPAPHTLTPEQKMASPYGLNIHSGIPNGDIASFIPPFMKAGVVWYRDYAWAYGWTKRAQGEDNKFAGWPYYDKVVRQAEELGIMLMPCMQESIVQPKEVDGKPVFIAPDRAWAQHLVLLMNAFPYCKFWELDNEYNGRDNAKKYEPGVQWSNYGAYHKKFAEIAEAIGGGEITVVQDGLAGIHPGTIESCVKRGDFAKVGVTNGHHYCGIEAPEINGSNMNTGGGGEDSSLIVRTFYDSIRDSKIAGCLDGKQRPFFVTEFAWDTLAVHIVTPYEQAVFLPRGWMGAMAAGADKLFWFGDADSPTPNFFFDGCGLLGPNPKKEPKLSLSSFAGLTQILPTPKYVGSLYAGEGSWGYLFRQDDKLVASLWMVSKDDGNTVNLQAEKLYDFLANPKAAGETKLSMAPVYAVGVSKDSEWYKQTAYELKSRQTVAASSGDSFEAALTVRNNRDKAIDCEIEMVLPEGWPNTAGVKKLSVKPGENADLPLNIQVPATQKLGAQEVALNIREDGKLLKKTTFSVQVREPLGIAVSPLGNKPGLKDVKISVANLSAMPRGGDITLKLPTTWKITPNTVKVDPLQPGEKREFQFKLDWSAGLKEGEIASATFVTGSIQAAQPLIPGTMFLHKLDKPLELNGNLSKWDDKYKLPGWTIGSTLGKADTDIWAAWSSEGLYMAFRVKDSGLHTRDPKAFWGGDCLELFIDSADNKSHREFEPGDHQFWFVPQVDKGNVYAGQWQRKKEIKETLYDLPGVKSFSKKEGDGYVMEFFLPASAIQNFAPQTGKKIGLSLCLAVKGAHFARDVFWPEAKNWAVINWPKTWGSVTLSE